MLLVSVIPVLFAYESKKKEKKGMIDGKGDKDVRANEEEQGGWFG